MKQTTFNFWIDLASFLVFFLLVLTGLLIYYVLPPCGNCGGQVTACDAEKELWGLGRHSYGTIHFYLSLLTVGLVVVHMALHWSWVCQTGFRLLGMENLATERQNRYGVIFLLACICLVIAILYWAKQQAI